MEEGTIISLMDRLQEIERRLSERLDMLEDWQSLQSQRISEVQEEVQELVDQEPEPELVPAEPEPVEETVVVEQDVPDPPKRERRRWSSLLQ